MPHSTSRFPSLLFVLFLVAGVVSTAPAADPPSEEPAAKPLVTPSGIQTLDNVTNRVSFSLGVNLARNLKYNYPEVNLDILMLGLRQAFSDNPPAFDENLINRGITEYNLAAQNRAQERQESIREANRTYGKRYLEDKAKQEGVIKLPSGLMYKVIEEGQGPSPTSTNYVILHYHGKLANGQVFDSTLYPTQKEPQEYRVDETIPAWQEVLPLMKLGAAWELYVPPSLGYGDAGNNMVPPASTLVYRLDLKGIR